MNVIRSILILEAMSERSIQIKDFKVVKTKVQSGVHAFRIGLPPLRRISPLAVANAPAMSLAGDAITGSNGPAGAGTEVTIPGPRASPQGILVQPPIQNAECPAVQSRAPRTP